MANVFIRATSLPLPCGCHVTSPSSSLPDNVPRHCPPWTVALTASSLKRRPNTSTAPSLTSMPPHSMRVSPSPCPSSASQRSRSSAFTVPLTHTPLRSGSAAGPPKRTVPRVIVALPAFGAPQQIHARRMSPTERLNRSWPAASMRRSKRSGKRFRGGLHERRRQVDREALQVRFDHDIRAALAGGERGAPVGRAAQSLNPMRAAGAARDVGIDASLSADAHRGVARSRRRNRHRPAEHDARSRPARAPPFR